MKRSLIFIICALVCIGTLRGELFWRITSPDGERISYLLGTHHTAPISMLDNITGFREAFASVDAIMGEVDMLSMDMSAQQSAMMKYAMAPSDSTISKVMTKEQCDSVADFIDKNMGMLVKFEYFEMFKPAMITTTISSIITQKAFPNNTDAGIDVFVQKNAAEQGKQILGFENIDFQMKLLFNDPIVAQVKELMEVVRDEEKAVRQAREMSDAYLTQNLEALYAMIVAPDEGMSAEEAEKLIYSRNRAWIPLIEKQMTSKSTMFVVGAGHLPGEQGVINLLCTKGYKVEPVK